MPKRRQSDPFNVEVHSVHLTDSHAEFIPGLWRLIPNGFPQLEPDETYWGIESGDDFWATASRFRVR